MNLKLIHTFDLILYIIVHTRLCSDLNVLERHHLSKKYSLTDSFLFTNNIVSCQENELINIAFQVVFLTIKYS